MDTLKLLTTRFDSNRSEFFIYLFIFWQIGFWFLEITLLLIFWCVFFGALSTTRQSAICYHHTQEKAWFPTAIPPKLILKWSKMLYTGLTQITSLDHVTPLTYLYSPYAMKILYKQTCTCVLNVKSGGKLKMSVE